MNFSKEQELIIFLSRVTFENKMEIIETKDINWFELFKLSLYHKTFTLCFENIQKFIPDKTPFPGYLQSILRYSQNAIKEQNELYMKEKNIIVEELKRSNIICIPVKGSMLIPLLYKEYGIRYMADIDCLVKHSDIMKIDKAMVEMGYTKGSYDFKTGEIEPVSRMDEIKWTMSMSNLYPYEKLTGNKNHPYYSVDFRYSLDDTLNKEPVNEIIDEYESTGIVNPAHILLHLCTHFYNEAKHTESILLSRDFNLIKLCDIREYVLQFMNDRNFDLTVSLAKKHDLQKAVYFTMNCLYMIYKDNYESGIMQKLEIEDVSFINAFGDSTKNENNRFNKNFWERLFSCGNIDELLDTPKFFKE
jgi:hypothetical protein